jgi:hypothetical protein
MREKKTFGSPSRLQCAADVPRGILAAAAAAILEENIVAAGVLSVRDVACVVNLDAVAAARHVVGWIWDGKELEIGNQREKAMARMRKIGILLKRGR